MTLIRRAASRWLREFSKTASIVGLASASLGGAVVLLGPKEAGSACQALTGLSSVHLFVLGFVLLLAIALIAIAMPARTAGSKVMLCVATEMTGVVVQYAAAIAGVVCGLIGFAYLKSGLPGLKPVVGVVIVCAGLSLASRMFQMALIEIRDLAGPIIDLCKAMICVMVLAVLIFFVLPAQNWGALSTSVDMCRVVTE